jgi:hypothetical protein
MSIGGELFGSADPEENQNITMYIENAGLSPFHASILFTDNFGVPYFLNHDDSSKINGFYTLRDLNSKSGTWSSIK